MAVITLSAPYGAGGSIVGPAVAERLDLPFMDRAIPAAVAEMIGCSLEEALAHDGKAEHGLHRLLTSAARAPNWTFGGPDPLASSSVPLPGEAFTQHTEAVIRDVADGGRAVILGRAAAIVLAGHARALHVRLDGPEDRRVAQVMRRLGLDEPAARKRVTENDRARVAYVRQFYRRNPADPALYHMVLDSTLLPLETCVELIVTAARAW